MLALEAIILPTGVRTVEIVHPDQGEAVARCRREGVDPYEDVPAPAIEGCDVLVLTPRWRMKL